MFRQLAPRGSERDPPTGSMPRKAGPSRPPNRRHACFVYLDSVRRAARSRSAGLLAFFLRFRLPRGVVAGELAPPWALFIVAQSTLPPWALSVLPQVSSVVSAAPPWALSSSGARLVGPASALFRLRFFFGSVVAAQSTVPPWALPVPLCSRS